MVREEKNQGWHRGDDKNKWVRSDWIEVDWHIPDAVTRNGWTRRKICLFGEIWAFWLFKHLYQSNLSSHILFISVIVLRCFCPGLSILSSQVFHFQIFLPLTFNKLALLSYSILLTWNTISADVPLVNWPMFSSIQPHLWFLHFILFFSYTSFLQPYFYSGVYHIQNGHEHGRKESWN